MKKVCMFFAALCTVCSALYAQTFYEGQGGKNLGGVRVSEIVPNGLSNDEAELIPLIQMTLGNDFNKYAGMFVPALEDRAFSTRYTLTGTITKTAGAYRLAFTIKDNSIGTTKTSYGPMQCTLQELQNFTVIKEASEELITGMGVTLTQAGKEALHKVSTRDAAMIALAQRVGATEYDRMYYSYEAQRLDPTFEEAAKEVAAYRTENYKVPTINLTMPDIKIPEIRVPDFKAPEIKTVPTDNIRVNALEQQKQYDTQREYSRARQESGNQAMKDLQDAFLAQFKTQSEAVKKQQGDLLKQRDILLGQQKTLLANQRQAIAKLRETENYYDTFFTEHPPVEIIYDPKVTPVGNANLEKRTINLQFRITTAGTTAMEVIPTMLADIEKGLGTITQGLKDINGEFDKIQSLITQAESAGNKALAQLVSDYAARMAEVRAAENDNAAKLAQLDRALNTTGYARLGQDYAVRPDTGYAERLAKEYAVQTAGYNASRDKTLGDTWSLTKWNKAQYRIFNITAWLLNDTGKTIGRASISLTNQAGASTYTQLKSASEFCMFRDIPVDDITDTLKVSIQSVNGRDVTAAANAGYIKISPLEANGYTKDGWSIDGYDRLGYNRNGYNRNGYDRDGYDRDGYDKDGYDKSGYKDGYDRNSYGRDGYDRDGYDRDGYDRNGYDKDDYDRDGYNRQGITRKEVRIAQEKAKRQKFARERLFGEIWAGGGSSDGTGSFMGGVNFGFRLGGAFSSGIGIAFPLSLIAETSISVGFDSAELLFLLDSYFKSGNVGGGLRLAADFSGSHYLLSLDLSVSGGVSFIRATAMPLPYLHMGGTFPVFLPVTGGVFIRFYPDDIDYSWYVGVKFRLP